MADHCVPAQPLTEGVEASLKVACKRQQDKNKSELII